MLKTITASLSMSINLFLISLFITLFLTSFLFNIKKKVLNFLIGTEILIGSYFIFILILKFIIFLGWNIKNRKNEKNNFERMC